MSIYDNNKELLSVLGVEGNYSTDFEVRKAILNALGGDASTCNSIYEVDLQILKIYQEGGGSAQKPVFKIKDDCSFRTNETEIPFDIDSSEVTDFSYMFFGCDNITTIPQLDTSNGTNFNSMFSNCYNLTTIPQLDTSLGTDFSWMFQGCDNLTNIEFIESINANIDFSHNTLLSYESVKSILTACSNTTNTNSKTLEFDRTLTDQNGELANLISTCNSRGWTISGLTLQ